MQQQVLWIEGFALNTVQFFVKRRCEFRGLFLLQPGIAGIAGIAYNGEEPGAAIGAMKPIKKIEGS